MNQSKNKFCIVTTQRSGSAWLISLLDSHPEIKAFYEIFLDSWAGDEYLVSFQNYQKANPGMRPEITFRYLKQLDTYPGNHYTIGFKIMYNQLGRHPEVLAKFALDGYKIIHLVRENHLDIAISDASMKQNGLIHSTKEVKANPVTLEPKFLLKNLERQRSQLNFARLLLKLIPNPILEITYDDLCQNRDKTLSSVIDFLGVPLREHTFNSDRKKVNKGSYQEKIANYEQVLTALSGTKYEQLLEH